jgi:hypothetical protein
MVFMNRKKATLRIIAGWAILCGLILNWGCQPNSIDDSSAAVITERANVEPSSMTSIVSPNGGRMQMTPTLSIPIEADMQNLINKAIADLAQRLTVPVNDIVLLEATSVVWPDGSLGCPQEGMQYAQVLTPGYLIRLKSGDQEYEYHSSKESTVIYCENPTLPVPGTPGDV